MERVIESRPGLIREANMAFFRRVLERAGVRLPLPVRGSKTRLGRK